MRFGSSLSFFSDTEELHFTSWLRRLYKCCFNVFIEHVLLKLIAALASFLFNTRLLVPLLILSLREFVLYTRWLSAAWVTIFFVSSQLRVISIWVFQHHSLRNMVFAAILKRIVASIKFTKSTPLLFRTSKWEHRYFLLIVMSSIWFSVLPLGDAQDTLCTFGWGNNVHQ